MKVSELSGPELDLWVAKTEYPNGLFTPWNQKYWLCNTQGRPLWNLMAPYVLRVGYSWRPSNNWEIGGPLIEKYRIELYRAILDTNPKAWGAIINTDDYEYEGYGGTPLIAACRCIIASVYGEEVPDE